MLATTSVARSKLDTRISKKLEHLEPLAPLEKLEKTRTYVS